MIFVICPYASLTPESIYNAYLFASQKFLLLLRMQTAMQRPGRESEGGSATLACHCGMPRHNEKKAFTLAHFLDYWKLRNFSGLVRAVATVDGLCGYVISRSRRCVSIGGDLRIYHICVRLLQSVARSTDPGNAKASNSGTSDMVRTLTLCIFITDLQREYAVGNMQWFCYEKNFVSVCGLPAGINAGRRVSR